MSLQAVYTNLETGSRLFLLRKIGSSLTSRIIHLEVPVYRALLVTGENCEDPNTNNMVVAAKFMNEDESDQSFVNSFELDLSLTSAARSASLVVLRESYRCMRKRVVTYEYMDRGSMYSVMVNKFRFCMPQAWVVHVLRKLFSAMIDGRIGGRICASQIFLSGEGVVKVGYGTTLMKVDGDPSMVGREEWDYLCPHTLWEVATPEQYDNTSDFDREKACVWHLGLTALELLYCGIRARDVRSLHRTVQGICAAGSLPVQKLSFGGAEEFEMEAYTDNGLPIHHPKRVEGPMGYMSREFQKMIIGCLMPTLRERTDLATLMAHPLFTAEPYLNEFDLL